MEYKFSKGIMQIKKSAADLMLAQMNSPDLISLAGGNPSADLFLIDEIKKYSNELLEQDPVGTLQYSVTEGYEPLRNQVRRLFYDKPEYLFDMDDEVIITSGSQQVPDLVAKCFCDFGDVILVEEPSYYLTLDTFRSNGAKLVGVKLLEDGIDISDLEEKIKKYNPKLFYIIPNFNNPTGITTCKEKRKKIYEICKTYKVLILEDNPYGKIRFTDDEIPTIKSLDDSGIVILAESLSKIISPGMRVSACMANKNIIAKLILAKRSSDVHTAIWGQRICERILANIDMKNHIKRISDHYKEKCDFMIEEIHKNLSKDVSYIKPQGGMFLWLTLPKRYSMNYIVGKLLEKKVAVVPGNIFYVDQDAECNSIRLNFSTPTFKDIKDGIEVFGKIFKEID